MDNLLAMKDKLVNKYPNAIKSWEDNWDNLVSFFSLTVNISKTICATIVIESLNSQFRKITKTKLIFLNDDSLMKMLYLATEHIAKKWSIAYADWDLVINQLNIIFSDILDEKRTSN